MEFHCAICTFTTHKKYNFEKHLKSQRHFINEKRPKVATKIAEVSLTVAEVSQPIQAMASPHKCKYCDQCYRHKSSLSKHIKYSCTKNKDEDLTELVRLLNKRIEQQENNMENQRQELTKTIETQSKQIEKLMGKLEISGSFNTTNNTINHFTLLPYRETDISHLTDQDYMYCIKRVNHCVKSMIEKVHFNPLKPENRNIYISNIKDKYIMLYDGQNWNVANKKDELDRLYEEKEMMLEEWLDSNPEEELKQKFMKYLDNKDNDECLNRIKEEIKMMIYNSHQKLVLKNSV
jgi:hypothetical protein